MIRRVIQAFADGETERFYTVGKSRRMPTQIRKRAAMRLVCFRFKNGDAFDVEIVDYH